MRFTMRRLSIFVVALLSLSLVMGQVSPKLFTLEGHYHEPTSVAISADALRLEVHYDGDDAVIKPFMTTETEAKPFHLKIGTCKLDVLVYKDSNVFKYRVSVAPSVQNPVMQSALTFDNLTTIDVGENSVTFYAGTTDIAGTNSGTNSGEKRQCKVGFKAENGIKAVEIKWYDGEVCPGCQIPSHLKLYSNAIVYDTDAKAYVKDRYDKEQAAKTTTKVSTTAASTTEKTAETTTQAEPTPKPEAVKTTAVKTTPVAAANVPDSTPADNVAPAGSDEESSTADPSQTTPDEVPGNSSFGLKPEFVVAMISGVIAMVQLLF